MRTPPSPLDAPAPSSARLIELYRNEFVTVVAEAEGPLVRMARTEVPFPSLEALEACYRVVLSALTRHGRVGRALLSDVRSAPGRNDPWFEDAMREIRPRLFEGFARTAVLVGTRVGALQLERLNKEGGHDRPVSTDEAALLEYLRGGELPHQASRRGPQSR
jgi:hypothetical protein